MTSALVTVTPATGWSVTDDVGYYIHKGFVYLNGIIWSDISGTTTQLLATFPEEARPPAPLHITIPYDLQNSDRPPIDPPLELAASYPATIHPDGSLRLDDPLPAGLLTAPSVADYFFVAPHISGGVWDGHTLDDIPRYSRPLSIGLLLGNVRWPLGAEPDSFTVSSLASYLAGGDFSDIDSGYVAHGERIHLSGHVKANVDTAATVLTSIPADAAAGLGSYSIDASAKSAGKNKSLYVAGGEVFVGTDTMKPAGESPPLWWSCPGFQSPYFPLADSLLFQNFASYVPSGLALDGSAPRPGILEYSDELDYGIYSCGSGGCRSPGPLPAYTFDLEALIASVEPQPPWFIIAITYLPGIQAPANDGCSGSSCGPVLPTNLPLEISCGAPFGVVDADGVTPASLAGSCLGYLAPAQPLYIGDPLLGPGGSGFPPGVAGIIWKQGQIHGTVTITPTAQVNIARPDATLQLIPLYELRQDGMHAGDVLDLTGSGWVGVSPTPSGPLPGTIDAGLGPSGIVRLGGDRRPRMPHRP